MAKKNGEEAFSSAQTPEQLALALQKRLASGELTTGETRAVELIAQLRGWTVGKPPKSSAPAEESPGTAKPVPFEEPHW
jgi:hypothetical protein